MTRETAALVRDVILHSGLRLEDPAMVCILRDIASSQASPGCSDSVIFDEWGNPVDGQGRFLTFSPNSERPAALSDTEDIGVSNIIAPSVVGNDSGVTVSGSSGRGIDESARPLESALIEEVSVSPTRYEDRDVILLRLFTCGLCRGLVYPTYMNCEGFHILCVECFRGMLDGRCSFCNGRGPYRRNYTLEGIGRLIEFPCRYKENGCNQFINGTEWSVHVNSCQFNPYYVPEVE